MIIILAWTSYSSVFCVYQKLIPDWLIQIQSLCLPFLRVASLLRYHLYEQPLPMIITSQSEFVRLVYYLELVTEGMSWDSFYSTVALNWQEPEAGVSVPLFWCDQLLTFLANWQGHQPARGLIMEQHISWQVPKLLSLPREYEKIFTVRVLIVKSMIKIRFALVLRKVLQHDHLPSNCNSRWYNLFAVLPWTTVQSVSLGPAGN